MSRSPALAGVILAAGSSSRMGRDKALLPWHGRTLLEGHINLLQAETDLVIVVVGENAEALKPVVWGNAASLAINPHPELGQFSSLRVGMEAVLNYGRDAAVIALVDRPPVSVETLRLLKSEFAKGVEEDMWAVVPEIVTEHGDEHGHPIIIGREMIEAFLRAPATSNARDVRHAHEERTRFIPVTDAAAATNWNTPEEYSKGIGRL